MLLITIVETIINVFSRTNLTLHFVTWCNYAVQLHPSLHICSLNICKSSSHQLKEKYLLNHEWKSYFHGLEIFKVLNRLLSQHRKSIVAEFFFKAHSPVVEMILFSKDSIAVAEICWNFLNSFSARACTCELFFATQNSNYTWTKRDRFWRLFHL